MLEIHFARRLHMIVAFGFNRSTVLAGAVLLFSQLVHATTATLLADANTNSAQPTSNFGILQTVAVDSTHRGLLNFNLGTLPPGTTSGQVAKATLTLWVKSMARVGGIDIKSVAGAWGELSVTDNT